MQLRGDADLEAQTARRGKLAHLESLLVPGRERRLRVDVGRVVVQDGEIAADEGDVHSVARKAAEQRLRYGPAKPQLAELHKARVHDAAPVARIVAEGVIVVHRAHLPRDDAVFLVAVDNARDRDAVLTTRQSAREDARVRAPRVGSAEELTTDAGVDLSAQVETLVPEGVDDTTSPPRLDVAEDRRLARRKRLARLSVEDQVACGTVPQEVAADDAAIGLTDARLDG